MFGKTKCFANANFGKTEMLNKTKKILAKHKLCNTQIFTKLNFWNNKNVMPECNFW